MKHSIWLLVLVCVGCGSTRVVTRTKLPPRSQAMGEPQRVVLAQFNGARGDDARRRVSSLIVRGKLHKIMDRSNQGLRQAELSKQLASGGATVQGKTGATVMVSADTLPDQYASNVERFEDKKCTRWDKKKRCTRYAKIPVYKLTESCVVGLTGRVTRIADGQVLVQREFRGSQRRSETQAKRTPASMRGTLCNTAAKDAYDQFAGFITPVETTVALDFRDVADGGRSDKAVEHAKRSRFKEARKLFETAVVDPALDEEARGWSRYNLGVVLWTLAEFDACVEQLDLAAQALPSADEVTQMRARCSEYLQ